MPDSIEPLVAMMAKVPNPNFRKENLGTSIKFYFKKKDRRDDRFCDNYEMNGHTRENYFKIISYPEWYKPKKGAQYTNFTIV